MKMKKRFVITLVIVALAMLLATGVYAADEIANSQLGTGISAMLEDVSKWLVIICPVAGGLAAVYFFVRRSMADEQEGKMWEKRIKVAIACGVGGTLVAGIIKLVSSYFE